MQMEPQISLDCEACIHPGSTWMNDSYCGVTASSKKCDGQPIATGTKKQTRQWAAWTRQEEEIFFNALRQFGKNFEKITCRVQSKNKDQVRHYYYRLVRRMNKLLGHGLCLDAKNSKDTNAAMLRWWSLLEKYSCKSSKLHLKPRRFKIFIETLEHQLLKDRKKSKRKPSSQGENYLPVTPTIISNHGRASGHDSPPVNLVLVDSENIQRLDSGKGPSVKRNVNVGINRRNCKSDSFPAKVARQRRKPASNASSAAYKRWEKAAIAGVSLVADAAEHLERTTIDKEVDHVQGHKGFDPAGKGKPPLPPPSPNSVVENNSQSSVKLKLQLFPIDEGTRKSLEMDNRNPHLELTLSTRKKISSVVEHLNRKWGNSNVASGELMLFPYYAQSENLAGYRRWTQDSVLSAADVYALIGSPSVFRLRYGWFSDAELLSPTFQAPVVSSGMVCNLNMNVDDAKEHSKDVLQVPTPSSDCQSGKLVGQRDKDQQVSGAEYTDVASSSTEVTNEIITCIGVDANNNLPESSVFWNRRNAGNGAIFREGDSKDNMQLRNGHSLSAGEWADSLTNVSVGDLLSEVSHNVDNGVDPLEMGSSQCPQQGPFSCDSFDAAIAAHIHRHQNKACLPPALSPFGSSIWDAEETCDAFSFQKLVPRDKIQGSSCIASSGVFKKIGGISLADSGASIKESLEVDVPTNDEPFEEPMDEETEDDNSAYGEPVDKCQSDTSVLENSPKNISGLTDMFWPDSLGPLDLDIPTCKYHTEDLILSDSLSGFNRLLGSSLDAFQNCSFFGFDKKETISTAEAKEPTSFSEYKIGSGVSDFAKA